MGDTKLDNSIRERRRTLRRSLGDQLRRTRLEAGLSIRDVGRAVDLDRVTSPGWSPATAI